MNIVITLDNIDIGTAENFRAAINKNSKTIIDAFPEVSRQVNEEIVVVNNKIIDTNNKIIDTNNKIIDTIISPARPGAQKVKDFWYKVI